MRPGASDQTWHGAVTLTMKVCTTNGGASSSPTPFRVRRSTMRGWRLDACARAGHLLTLNTGDFASYPSIAAVHPQAVLTQVSS